MNTISMQNNYKLSILIPSRNEEWLSRTVQDILEHKRGDTEVLVGLDGQWAEPPIEDHKDVRILYYPKSIGQRAMTNQLCRLSNAKYVMKVDAHCAFDEGFDVKMIDAFTEVGDDVTMVPVMRNLWVFDWVCDVCGNRWYQGPTPTFCFEDYKGKVRNTKCSNTTNFHKETMWVGKKSPQSTSYRFDKTLHFQYFGQWKKNQEGDLVETMSLQGSCFMLTRAKYWELNICDEKHGSWGQQGVETACATWLSGGRVLCNKRTWYAHMFRTQGGDFDHPFPLSGGEIEKARQYSRDMWFNNKHKSQIHPLAWLIEKFKPVPGWHDDVVDKPAGDMEIQESTPRELTKGIIFYTDNQIKLKIAHAVQKQLSKISKDLNIPIVSASLKPMPHFGHNIHLPLQRHYLTMFKQILAALEASTADVIFFCEHDVIYHPSHFNFLPERRDVFYYNVNVWKIRFEDHFALWVDDCAQVSGLCGYREELIKHYKERIDIVERTGYPHSMGFEPGARNSWTDQNKENREWFKNRYSREYWKSEFPNLDIRHDKNLTKNRWDPSLFRNKDNCRNWTESTLDKLPGWSGVVL